MPQAFHSGCAARARATAVRTSVGPAQSSSPSTSPVAGLTDAMRETANWRSVAICGKVYSGRKGRATGSTIGSDKPQDRSAATLAAGARAPCPRRRGADATRIRRQPDTARSPARSPRPPTDPEPRGCDLNLPGSVFPSQPAGTCPPGCAPCDEETRCRARSRRTLRPSRVQTEEKIVRTLVSPSFPCVPLCPLWLRSWPAAKRSTRSGSTAANEVKSCSPTTPGAASIIAASSSGNG